MAEPEPIDSQTRGEVLSAAYFYGPTFLTDEDSAVTLFARRFRTIRLPKGKVVVRAARDTRSFPNEAAMLVAIEQDQMCEWDVLDDNPPLTTDPPAPPQQAGEQRWTVIRPHAGGGIALSGPPIDEGTELVSASDAASLRTALEELWGIVLNDVPCAVPMGGDDPEPCEICAPVYERVRKALSDTDHPGGSK